MTSYARCYLLENVLEMFPFPQTGKHYEQIGQDKLCLLFVHNNEALNIKYFTVFCCHCALGPSPQYSKGTYIPVFPTAERQSIWRGRVIETSGNVVTMGITPSPECIVGKYMIYVGVVTPYGIRRTRRDTNTDVYILFNPWSSGFKFLSFWEKNPYYIGSYGVSVHI